MKIKMKLSDFGGVTGSIEDEGGSLQVPSNVSIDVTRNRQMQFHDIETHTHLAERPT